MSDMSVLLVGVEDSGIEAELSDAGFDVVRAPSPWELSLESEVDVLLLALGTAGPLETYSVVRSAAPDAAIVVLTEPDRDTDGQAAMRAGAEDHVSRPSITRGVLPRVLRQAVERNRTNRELRSLDVTDELTRLPNIRGFALVAEHHFRMADRSREPVVLVFLRIDDLDDLRTELGEIEADAVVVDAAQVILHGVRDADYPGRIAEDTFCVLLTGHAGGSEPIVMSRLVEAIATRNALGDRPRPLSLSIGSAIYDPTRPMSTRDILEEARKRMQQHRPGGDATNRSEGT